MKLTASKGVIILIGYLTVCAFQMIKPKSGSKGTCKDGTMEVRDTTFANGTSKWFVFGTDTIELPYCTSFPCTGRMSMEMDSDKKRMHIVSTIKHAPVAEPFYFRKDVYIFVGITPEQERDFDWFKQQVYNGVKDTALRAELWFELSSTEAAMKNDDAASYIIGVRHLSETWAKISPPQYYSGSPEPKAK